MKALKFLGNRVEDAMGMDKATKGVTVIIK